MTKQTLAMTMSAMALTACTANVLDVGGADPESTQWTEPHALSLAGDDCFPYELPLLRGGETACVILEARSVDGSCSCDAPARRPVSDDHTSILADIEKQEIASYASWNCFCEDVQLQDSDLAQCQTETATNVDGWCYVDATTAPPTGNPNLVSTCPSSERRMIRFVGHGFPLEGAMSFVACVTE